jgi:hypothetical protein
MTQLLDDPSASAFAGIPQLTPGAAMARAVTPTPTPEPAPEPRVAADPDTGRPADAAPEIPPAASPAARPGRWLLRSILAAAALIVALAAVAAAAGLLTFPQAARFSHLSSRDISWLIPVAAIAATAALVAALRTARRLLKGHRAADVLTVVAAGVATVVAGTGMWRFFDVFVQGLPVEVRIPIFAFLELGTFAEALRARDNMRDFESAGVDGIAMWILTGTSAFLSSLASQSLAEALFRLAPPLVAAWFWERSLVAERRRATGRATIHWRITPERILVRLRLAEPTGRAIGDVAAQRWITQLAVVATRAGALEDAGAVSWRRTYANRRLRIVLQQAVEHADLAVSEQRQQEFVSQVAILRGYRDLARLAPATPWAQLTAAGWDEDPGSDGHDHQEEPHQDAGRNDDENPGASAASAQGDGDLTGGGTAPPDLPHHATRSTSPDEAHRDAGPEKEPDAGPEKDTGSGAGPRSPYTALADELTRALHKGADDGPTRIRSLLGGRSDHQDLVRWLGQRSQRGDKRLMTLVAFHAIGRTDSPAAVSNWIAALVPGPAGHLDKTDIRRVRQRLLPEQPTGENEMESSC